MDVIGELTGGRLVRQSIHLDELPFSSNRRVLPRNTTQDWPLDVLHVI